MLENYGLRLVRPACDPAATTVNAIVDLEDDLSDILPYLNGSLRACRYYPQGPFVRFILDGRVITVHPRQMTITRLESEEQARQVMGRLRALILDVYRRRDDITPSIRSGTELRALDVFRLLPATNCGACGEPTCLAFAVKLVSSERALADCVPLDRPEHKDRRARLREALELAGLAGQEAG